MVQRFPTKKESLIEQGDDWDKIEERTIEFYAMMICCADYPIRLKNYSDIDDIRSADDFEDTMFGYRILARKTLKFGKTEEFKNCDNCQELLKQLQDENEQLKQSLHNKIDSDAWWEKKATERVEELEKENEQLKQQMDNLTLISARIQAQNDELKKELSELKELQFICLDCEHCGYTEIGCLCEHKDCWVEYRNKCDDFKKGEWVDD